MALRSPLLWLGLLWAYAAVPGAMAAAGDVSHGSDVVPLQHGSQGAIAHLSSDLQSAIRHYRQARIADPNDIRLNEGLFLAEEEYRAEAHLSRLFTPHFVVAYPHSLRPRQANRIADRLELVYQAVGGRFASFPTRAFTVVLYPDREFHAATFSPAWARGLFDGKIRLRLERDGHIADGVLIHEYVHAIAHVLSQGHVPAWLSEGLALSCDGGHTSWTVRSGPSSSEYVPLTVLHADLVALPAHSARTAYRQSYEATRALLDRYGFVRLRQLLERAAHTADFTSAFEAVLGQPYLDFQRQWIAEQGGEGF